MSKVLFYVERDLHLPFLLPVFKELEKKSGIELVFCSPKYISSTLQSPGKGLEPIKSDKLKQLAPVIDLPEVFQPDVTVIADACQFLLPEHIGPTVNVGHGLICKGTFYTSTPRSRRENLSSVICVPGPWHKKKLLPQVDIPIEITGFIKTDMLVAGHILHRKDFNLQHRLPDNPKNILYAPTFNPELSSLPYLLPILHDLPNQDTNLLIKLHNMTPPPWVDYCQKLAAQNENIVLLQDNDYTGMMHNADLMLSDISSIFVEFMLMDKPVLLFQHKNIKKFNTFDPADIEYQVLPGVTKTETVSELKSQILSSLAQPQIKSDLRTKYCHALDYKRDGKSAARVAKIVIESLNQKHQSPKSVKKFLVILDGQNCCKEIIINSWQQVQNTARFHLVDIYCSSQTRLENISLIKIIDMKELSLVIKKSSADYLILLQPGWNLPADWFKHLALHLFWEPEGGMVRALAQPAIGKDILQNMGIEQTEKMPVDILSHYLRTVGIGSSGWGICGPTPCFLTPLTLAQQIIQNGVCKSVFDLSNSLKNKIANDGRQILTALDVLSYPSSADTPEPRY